LRCVQLLRFMKFNHQIWPVFIDGSTFLATVVVAQLVY
jgi:hypothetical protein